MADVAGKAITTLEAVGNGKLHPVQEAWIAESVPQCGYCQAGQIIQRTPALGHPKARAPDIDRR